MPRCCHFQKRFSSYYFLPYFSTRQQPDFFTRAVAFSQNRESENSSLAQQFTWRAQDHQSCTSYHRIDEHSG